MKTTGRILTLFCAASLGTLALTSCKKGASGGAEAFRSAPPEVKKLWDGATAAMTTNGYAKAILQLRQLRALPGLSAEQARVVEETTTRINDQMYDAANREDPAGKQALQELRESMGR